MSPSCSFILFTKEAKASNQICNERQFNCLPLQNKDFFLYEIQRLEFLNIYYKF